VVQHRRPVSGSAITGVVVALTVWMSAPHQPAAQGRQQVRQAEPIDPPRCELDNGEARSVARIIDGETLLVDGGTEVRLIGALAPRAFDAASSTDGWPLAELARATLEKLVAGQAVSLVVAGRRVDRYGRLLAHVLVNAGSADQAPLWVQGEMLKRGLARAYALDGSTRCLAELIAHESVARDKAAGLWAEPAYAVRGADDTTALMRLAGTFQVIEGTALRVGPVRGSLYVNFGEDWRQDFTLLIRDRAVRAAIASGLDAALLTGRRIRVRGWVERRGGPLIEVVHPAAIEVLADAAGAQASAAPTASRRRARRKPIAE
jgi:endonuclease YncB( thermonuclease family)